ncbi:MAG: hypothetical protein ACOX87_12945, partial [Chloroflexota bacterium]
MRPFVLFKKIGNFLPVTLIAASSLAAALLAPASSFGASSPLSWGTDGVLSLIIWWAALAGWALIFAALLKRLYRLSQRCSLYLAAGCHLPLLLCLFLLAAIYQGNDAGQLYLSDQVGRKLFQPLARDFVLFAPLALQAVALLAYGWRTLAGESILIFLLGASIIL